MADFKPKVISSAGHDKLLDDTDNLVLVNAPAADSHGANKKYIDDAIDTEEAARIAADNQLQSNIDAEEAARIAADNQLQSNIDAEAGTRGDADTDLQNQIDAITGGDTPTSNIYVKRSGDNMSGNLTFDTNKIVLNADGTATFAGHVVRGVYTVNSNYVALRNGQIEIGKDTNDDNSGLLVGTRYNGGTTTEAFIFKVDGSATLAGHLEAASIDGGSY